MTTDFETKWLCYTGTGSGISRSVGNNECPGGEMDTCPAGRAWYYVRVATVSSSSVFHQTKTDLIRGGRNSWALGQGGRTVVSP